MTEYVSTRGQGGKIGYGEAIMQGLAPDRGLYVPGDYPRVDQEFIASLRGRPYAELFTEINSLFVGDEITMNEQRLLAEAAYSSEKFPDANKGDVTPVTWLTDRIAIEQLSLGPTAAFKDMALQPLGQHLNHVLNSRGETLRMLGATSGDTGSSAEAAVKGLSRVSLTMLSPVTGMSRFQQAQMAELSGGNITNLSVDGRFDDCQDMVKALKSMPEFADLGAVNSINWGRVAAQVPYYFSGYLQAVGEDIGKQVDFVVPSGNFGNVLAGYIAKKMGLLIRTLVVATNENNVTDTLIQTGVYELPGGAQITSSPSMDITKASNYERVLLDLMDPDQARAYMQQFEVSGRVSFSDFDIPMDALKQLGFDSGVSKHSDRLSAIKWAHDHGMLIDPHTGDAVTVARKIVEQCPDDTTPLICMSTALPVKFEDTMQEALGYTPKRPERFIGLEERVKKLGTGGFAAVLKAGDLDTLAYWVRNRTT